MLAWALRYLAVVTIVGVAFAVLQDKALLRPQPEHASENQRTPQEAFNQHVVQAGPNGHFLIEAVVNGEPVNFLVDTGASDVVLDPDDAERLGFERHALAFEQRYRTANGTVRAARVTLRELRIGQQSLFDVDASVNEASDRHLAARHELFEGVRRLPGRRRPALPRLVSARTTAW